MLWLGLYLPNLSLEVCTRGAPTPDPLAISAGEGRAQQVFACNVAAQRLGVQPGMLLSSAYGLAGNLRVKARAAAAEQAALERLAVWAGQFTSFVNLVPPQSLILEISGSLRLFGGAKHLLKEIRQGLRELGFEAHRAVAPTPLSATWLARTGREIWVGDGQALRAKLAALPLHRLDITEDQRAILHGIGVRYLGDCLRLPRAGLARRLGVSFVRTLEQALGKLPDPRSAFVAPTEFNASVTLPTTVDSAEGLLFPIHRLTLELAGFLRAREAGVEAIMLKLHHPKVPITTVTLSLSSPTRDAAFLIALVRERLERVMLPEPVEEVTLQADRLRPFASRSLDFFTAKPAGQEARWMLIEHLRARLGKESVQGLSVAADHRPERAWNYVEPTQSKNEIKPKGIVPPRPLWLLSEPVLLPAREHDSCLVPEYQGKLILNRDCERIESGWWDGVDATRDYFIATDTNGARFWIFRELSGERRWFLHGIFA